MRDVKETCIIGGLVALVATMSMLLASPPPADAAPYGGAMARLDLPSSMGVVCERRSSAHVAEHGGIHEDSRWHIARGELPNCDDNAGSDHNDDQPSRNNEDNEKSRFCKRKFYC